jgi:hypothetical protein
MFSLIKELSKHGLKAVPVERFASFQISHGCGGKMAVAYKRNGEPLIQTFSSYKWFQKHN